MGRAMINKRNVSVMLLLLNSLDNVIEHHYPRGKESICWISISQFSNIKETSCPTVF